jgi:hypothetical protein
MIKIKFFSSFTTGDECKAVYERLCNIDKIDFYGKNKKIYFTNDDDDDYTHAIIINTATPELNIPKSNVIGFAFEPICFLRISTSFIEYATKHINKYFIGDKSGLPEPFTEHFGYMWYATPPKEIKCKSCIMSIVLSEKKFAPGHEYRHALVKEIIKHNLPIHIYGYGSTLYEYEHVKGSFNYVEPYETYLYSICIENFQSNHYFSEKIINPILYECMPIYIGCVNIDNYFDDIIKMTGDINNDILLIKEILHNPIRYYKKPNNTKNLKTINLIENVERLYNS